MKEPLTITMTKEDADEVEKIFNRNPDPKFSVVGKVPLSEDTVVLSIIAESGLHIWYLAKEVQINLDFNKRINEVVSNVQAKIQTDISNLKNLSK